ncbi:APC family permease [Streptomyces sp. MST-110588]|uniref:APC family permease n=1 Tax=Streptomyces sp. MST-110588 TaxID=2833628 RepID=UPI001F5CE7B7|nr:APC family permease [Streptomyces sp. MST-110588]UNO40138.1 APC family permease [Streptomyces sp. MST-110588]
MTAPAGPNPSPSSSPSSSPHSSSSSFRGATGEPALRRALGFRDLIVYGLLFIAPMAPVGIFGTLQAKSHGAIVAVYLVATVAMAFTAFSYAQMVRVAPRAGSVFAYARTGLGEGAGFVAGWMAMLDYLLIPAVAYLFSGIAMHALVPSVHQWVWTAVAVAVTTLLNLWGVRAAAVVGLAVLALEIAVLAVFVGAAVWTLAADGARRGWAAPFTGEGGFSTGAVLSAVSVAVLSYLGFDAIASFAEETAGGAARVARAVITCLVVAGALFAVQTYLAALLAPMPAAELAARPAEQGDAFYATVDSAVGDWLHDLVAVSKAVGAAFAALAGQAAAGRLLFAMARDRRLPGAMAKVDAGSGVPRRALLGAALVTLVAAVWAARRDDGLDHLSSIVNVGALTAFALLHASVIGYFRFRGRPASASSSPDAAAHAHPDALPDARPDALAGVLKHVAVPLLGLAVVIAVVVTASTTAQIVAVGWLAAGLLVLAAQHGGRRRRKAGATG